MKEFHEFLQVTEGSASITKVLFTDPWDFPAVSQNGIWKLPPLPHM